MTIWRRERWEWSGSRRRNYEKQIYYLKTTQRSIIKNVAMTFNINVGDFSWLVWESMKCFWDCVISKPVPVVDSVVLWVVDSVVLWVVDSVVLWVVDSVVLWVVDSVVVDSVVLWVVDSVVLWVVDSVVLWVVDSVVLWVVDSVVLWVVDSVVMVVGSVVVVVDSVVIANYFLFIKKGSNTYLIWFHSNQRPWTYFMENRIQKRF